MTSINLGIGRIVEYGAWPAVCESDRSMYFLYLYQITFSKRNRPKQRRKIRPYVHTIDIDIVSLLSAIVHCPFVVVASDYVMMLLS